MAGLFARRSTLTAAVAALATVVTPFSGAALGAPAAFSASSITTSPAPDSNNVVQANRPQIIATFSDDLASSSTITLTEKGKSTNLCSSFQVSDTHVRCTPSADLSLDKTYDAVGHGVSKSGAKADTDKLEFTVDYPKFDGDNSAPVPNGAVVSGNEALTAQFNEEVTGNKDTHAADGAFKVFEVNPDGSRGTQLPGTIAFPSSPITGSDNSVTFTGSLTNGKYEAVILVNGVNSDGNINHAATGTADYYFFIDNRPPANLSSPAYANNVNDTAFPFSGTAAPGLTVNVTVPDTSDPTGLSDATGSGVVPTCDAAPDCPWTVEVDVSGLGDSADDSAHPGQKKADIDWTANTSDAASKTSAGAAGPPFAKDTSAPSQPTVKQPKDGSSVTTTVPVEATDNTASPSDVTSYHVTVTDPENNTVEQDIPANASHDLAPTTVDISPLDDGDLTVLIQAQDAAGNRSDAPSQFPPGQTPSPHVTKKTSFLPNLSTSTLTGGGADTTFTDATTHAVHSPSKVTLKFSQTVTLSYTDNSKLMNTSHKSSMCVATLQGNCVAGGAPTLTDDKHGIVITLANPLPDRSYTIVATTYAAGLCPDVNPGGTDNCQQDGGRFSGQVQDPSTGQPFTFTVDTTPPTVAVTTISPKPITASGVTNVTISGTVSPDVDAARGVQLVLKSSGGGARRIVQAGVTPAASGASAATWSATGIDLSAMPDGTLTVTAKAFDTAGNSGTDKATAKLAAHRSKLTSSVSDGRIGYGHAVTVHGRLTDPNGDGIVSATITIQPRLDSGRKGRPTTATTDSKGRWSVLAAPQHNTTYTASYAGSTTTPLHDAVSNHHARVRVHARIVITSPDAGKVSSPVKVKGKVSPRKRGTLVKLYRKTAHGRKLLGTDRLNRHSHFSIRTKLPKGKIRIFATVGATRSNLGDTSPKLRLRVH